MPFQQSIPSHMELSMSWHCLNQSSLLEGTSEILDESGKERLNDSQLMPNLCKGQAGGLIRGARST
jgi:hypothetical protein